MKKTLTAIALILTMLVTMSATAFATTTELDLSEKAVYARIMALQTQYPTGMKWDDNTAYKGITACSGFAYMLNEAAFGEVKFGNWPHRYLHTVYDIIRIGDNIGYGTHVVTVIGIDVKNKKVTVAEGNINSKVGWGREMTFEALKNVNAVVQTFYPDTTILDKTTQMPATALVTTRVFVKNIVTDIDRKIVITTSQGHIQIFVDSSLSESQRASLASVQNIFVTDNDRVLTVSYSGETITVNPNEEKVIVANPSTTTIVVSNNVTGTTEKKFMVSKNGSSIFESDTLNENQRSLVASHHDIFITDNNGVITVTYNGESMSVKANETKTLIVAPNSAEAPASVTTQPEATPAPAPTTTPAATDTHTIDKKDIKNYVPDIDYMTFEGTYYKFYTDETNGQRYIIMNGGRSYINTTPVNIRP